MGLLDFLTGNSKNDRISEMLKDGAQIVDVRSPGEYASGHVKGSINIPLNEVGSRAKELKKHKHGLVLCCASGMRSGSATATLSGKGLNCVNGGGWSKVQRIVSEL